MTDAWPDAEAALAGFLARYEAGIAERAGAAMRRLRDRLPGARALIYDNYNGLVLGFSPTERPSEAILSIVVYPRHFSLCFLQGAGMTDPYGLLEGGGTTVRHVRLEGPETLEDPKISQLIDIALAEARVPMPTAGGGMVVKSVSAKQRPRRP